MAFTVETGLGISNANSYITTEFADTYHQDRGNSAWAGSPRQREAAIIRATDYIDKRFGRRFRGSRMQKSQSLEWPRLAAYDDDQFHLDGVPAKLQQACAEYALRALSLPALAPDPSSSTSGPVNFRSERVGPIEEKVAYGNVPNRDTVSGLVSTSSIPEYPEADLLMVELLKSGNAKRIARG